MCCQWVESERPKAIIPCFKGILTLFYSSWHKNTVKFGGKLDYGLFGSYKGSKNEFNYSLFNTVWICTSRLGNFQDTHTRKRTNTHAQIVNPKKAICQPLCQMKWNSGTTDIKKEKWRHQRKGVSVSKHNAKCEHHCLNDTTSFSFIHTTSKTILCTDIYLQRE
jgi:hypothetical protein